MKKETELYTAPRPSVLSYLAPAVRVEILDGDLKSGYQPGTPIAQPVAADIQKVQVTLENSGCSQYSITLNNWNTDPNPSASGTTWPRYRYNDFSTFKFGRRLRLWMRYWPDLSRSSSEATRRSHAWVPMISGPITDMQFTFGERSELTLAGEDDLSRLKDKHDK